jgi:hypothetical protein
MKKTILVITMALATFNVSALTCEQLDSVAGSVMEARQSGVHLSELKGKLEESGFWDQFEFMVLDAYKQTRWDSESNQKKAVSDFRNEYYILCLELKNDK